MKKFFLLPSWLKKYYSLILFFFINCKTYTFYFETFNSASLPSFESRVVIVEHFMTLQKTSFAKTCQNAGAHFFPGPVGWTSLRNYCPVKLKSEKSIRWKKTRNVWSFPLFGWDRIASDSLIYICLNIAVIELSLMWRLILANFPYYLDTIYWWYRANIGLRIMYEEKLIIGPQ